MESTYKQFTAACCKGNLASLVCNSSDCQHPSLICNDQSCSCLKPHSDCPSTSVLKQLKKKLEAKSGDGKVILYEIVKWYENISKLILVEIEYVQKMIDHYEIILEGNQEKFYNSLIEGKSEHIVPKLVADVVKTLFSKNQSKIETKLQQSKITLAKTEKELQVLLNEVRKLTQTKQKIILQKPLTPLDSSNVSNTSQVQFNRTWSYPDLLTSHNRIVKVSKPTSSWLSAFVDLPLFQTHYSKYTIKFRILFAKSNGLMFGVYQKHPSFKSTDTHICGNIHYGSITQYSGNVYIGQQQGHKKESINIGRYLTNDIVEVEFERETEKVTVRNMTEGTQ